MLKALNDPKYQYGRFYIRCKANVEWRNRFIIDNVIKIFENEAKRVDKDVYILVGHDHVTNMKKQFAQRGYEVDTSKTVEYDYGKDCQEVETLFDVNNPWCCAVDAWNGEHFNRVFTVL